MTTTTVDRAREVTLRTLANIEKVIVGKRSASELALVAILAGGHILIEDVPGVGKTMLARSLAISLGASFKRVQFTPDLLPSDVIGVNLYNQRTGEFEFRPGPVLAHLVLADEINRGTPKTQSALLEAMEEARVTVDGVTHTLPRPFFVFATQNPLEHEGTFLLPEAQRDRFFLRIRLGYPSTEGEIEIMERLTLSHPIDALQSVSSPEEVLEVQATVRTVYVDGLIKRYIAEIVDRTREDASVYVGASPRGALALFRGAQARAVMEGRDYVLPDDVKGLILPVLSHRIILSPTARMQDVTVESILTQILNVLPVPGSTPRGWLRN
ncbi:MAG: MoxR family ATPase [Chloroflexi bacterium]|nr:MoxR family ATPase [Chloroflexota bacterium]